MSEHTPTHHEKTNRPANRRRRSGFTLRQRQFQSTQAEKFGALDQTAANEDEISYTDYLAQRPAKGIYRQPEVFVQYVKKTGQSDSKSAQTDIGRYIYSQPGEKGDQDYANHSRYQKQVGPLGRKADDAYYDSISEIIDEGIAEDLSLYDDFSQERLIFAAAEKMLLGDRAGYDDMRALYEVPILNEVTEPGTNVPIQKYDDDMAHFDREVKTLVARFIASDPEQYPKWAYSDDLMPAKPTKQEILALETAPDETIDEQPAHMHPLVDNDHSSESDQSSKPDRPIVTEKATVRQDLPLTQQEVLYAFYQGRQVTLQKKFRTKDGIEKYQILTQDGETKRINTANVQIGPDYRPTAPERDTNTQTTAKEKASLLYWGNKLANFRHNAADWAINRRTDGLDEQQAERQRARNRRVIIALGAGAALLGLGVAIGYGVGHSIGEHAEHARDVAQDPTLFTPTDTSAAHEHVRSISDAVSQPAGSETVASPPAPDVNFTISHGEGGYALFQSEGLSSAQWNQHAEQLLQQYPADFYRMPGGGVGLSHQGLLSQGAQDFIRSLKN